MIAVNMGQHMILQVQLLLEPPSGTDMLEIAEHQVLCRLVALLAFTASTLVASPSEASRARGTLPK